MGKGFIGSRQTTLASEVVLTGTGVHSGAPVSITLHPADADTGIRFIIMDGDEIKADIAADYRSVENVTLCTVLGDGNGGTVSTVEHLLAAFRGLSVDNATVEIDNAEVPIMDGSAAPFVDAIDEAGICELHEPRRFIKVLKPIRVEDGDCWGELLPHSGFHVDVEINFDTPFIGRQRRSMEMNPGAFRAELSKARTFGFMKDVERLWAIGRALGASLENTVALGEDRIINPEGLRYEDEFVRHKMLDAVGDMALAGSPMLCAYRSRRGGHRLNSLMLNALFADQDAWCVLQAPHTTREAAHAGVPVGVAAVNYAADQS
ncbi:MAG: UDP-3-O-acyl-N-acetylglucosamine deacetylase [Hyphomicrobiaceae bacterium]